MSVVVTYRAPTESEALGRYHIDALGLARHGWVPFAEHRRSVAGEHFLAVTYRRNRAAVSAVIEVLEAILEPATPVRSPRPPRGRKPRGFSRP